MTISPTAAEARSTMTFIITPEHVMPSAGVLRITLDKNYTTSIYSSTLLGTSPVCIGITVQMKLFRTIPLPTYIAL